MYRCEFCHESVCERMTRVVTITRAKEYPDGAKGWEVVREVPSCRSCATARPNLDAHVTQAWKAPPVPVVVLAGPDAALVESGRTSYAEA